MFLMPLKRKLGGKAKKTYRSVILHYQYIVETADRLINVSIKDWE
jgi:hypothetical protein